MVRVAIETFEEGRWESATHGEFSDLPEFLSIDPSHLFVSSLSEDETRARLAALGWTEESRVFLWYRADQLAFGVDAGDTEEGPAVFIVPIEDRCDFDYKLLPYEDNLHGECLEAHPEFLGHTTSENTFELAENLGVNEIKLRMMALGYTHDPEIDNFGEGGQSLPLSGAGQPTGFGPAPSPAWTPGPITDQEAVRFRVGTRNERVKGGPEHSAVRVAVEFLSDGSWHSAIDCKLSGLPDFLSIDGSRLYASALPEAETIAHLRALGWTEEPRVFLWYRPDQLAFGVIEPEDDDPQIFLAPIEDRCDFDYEYPPFEDDLRGDGLEVHPDFMGDDIMENTFPLVGNIGVNEARMRMMALGFVHNPEIEKEM